MVGSRPARSELYWRRVCSGWDVPSGDLDSLPIRVGRTAIEDDFPYLVGPVVPMDRLESSELAHLRVHPRVEDVDREEVVGGGVLLAAVQHGNHPTDGHRQCSRKKERPERPSEHVDDPNQPAPPRAHTG